MEEKISFIPFHWGQFLAGLAFLAIGITSFSFYSDGLLLFLFPLPTYMVTGVIPLVVGFLFAARALVIAERVEISRRADASITIRARGLLARKVEYKMDEIDTIGFSFKGSKFIRWVIVYFMLVVAIEAYLENGVDLLGTAPVAAYLLFCFVLVMAGLGFYIGIPRKFIEIGTKTETRCIPLPASLALGTGRILDILGVHPRGTSSRQAGLSSRCWHVARDHAFHIIVALFLLAWGMVLVLDRSFFFGEFTAPAAITVAAKMIQEVIRGDKVLVPSMDEQRENAWKCFIGSGVAFTFLAARAGVVRHEENTVLPHLFTMHFAEAACLGYIAWQAVKYGFRFAWWGAFVGPHAGLILLAVAILCIVAVQWTRPVNGVSLELGGYARRFRVIGKRAGPRTRARDFTRWLQGARHDRKLLQALAVFAGAVTAAACFYLLSGPFPVI